MESTLSRDTIQYLSRQLGKEWKTVGRNLGLDDPLLDKLEIDYKDAGHQEMTYQLLLRWGRKDGAAATNRSLIGALRKTERTDLADHVETIMSPLFQELRNTSGEKVPHEAGTSQGQWSYKLGENRDCYSHRSEEKQLRVIVLGTGRIGNVSDAILGRRVYSVDINCSPVVFAINAISPLSDSREINVACLPGVPKLADIMTFVMREGVHLFVHVLDLRRQAAVGKAMKLLEHMQKSFEEFSRYCLLVLIFANQQPGAVESLDEYINIEKRNCGKKKFFDQFGWRMIALEERYIQPPRSNRPDPSSRVNIQHDLLGMIEKIVLSNGTHPACSHESFTRAKQLQADVEGKCSECHPVIISAVMEAFDSGRTAMTAHVTPEFMAEVVLGVLRKSEAVFHETEDPNWTLYNDGGKEEVFTKKQCIDQICIVYRTLTNEISARHGSLFDWESVNKLLKR